MNGGRSTPSGTLVAMERFASANGPLGRHPGGLAWEWAIEQTPEDIEVMRSGDRVVGWLGRISPTELEVHTEREVAGAAEAVVARMLQRAEGTGVSCLAADADARLRTALESAGFRVDERAPWHGLWRTVDDVPAYRDRYLIRSVRPDEMGARVEVHRAARRPADLPYAAEHAPQFPPEATSRSTLEHYERVRTCRLYDPDLDLVAEAPDGSLAACCIGWYDPAARTTEIEPLGVHPAHRRRGLAQALCHEVGRLTAERDGQEVFIK